MKIIDVSVTLFAWDDIPPTTYGAHSRFSGSSALGLLRIITDEGLEGHAFLGSASNSATRCRARIRTRVECSRPCANGSTRAGPVPQVTWNRGTELPCPGAA